MARRRKKPDRQMHLKVLVLAMLFFSYIVQPYMPNTEKTFAHSYYSDLFSEFYESLSYGAVYAQTPLDDLTDDVEQTVNQVLGNSGCVENMPYLYLTWNKNGNPDNTNYIVYRSGGGQSDHKIANQTNNSYNDTNYNNGLVGATEYTYRVESENEDGVHNGNVIKSAWTLPDIPALLTSTVTNGNIHLEWSGCDNGGETVYGVLGKGRYPRSSPDVQNETGRNTTDNTFDPSVSNGYFKPNLFYDLEVVAYNGIGQPSEPSNLVQVWSQVNIPKEPVAARLATGVGTGINLVTWESNDNPQHTDYVVCRRQSSTIDPNPNPFGCLLNTPVSSTTFVACPTQGNVDIQCARFTQTSITDNNVPYVGADYKVVSINKGCNPSDDVPTPTGSCVISESTPVGNTGGKTAWLLDFQNDWSTGTGNKALNTQVSAPGVNAVVKAESSNKEQLPDSNGVLEISPTCVKGLDGLCTATSIYTFTMNPTYGSGKWKNKSIGAGMYAPPGTSIELWWSSATATNPLTFISRCKDNEKVCAPDGQKLKLEIIMKTNNPSATPTVGLIRVNYDIG